MRISKKILIISIMLFFALMHNVNAIYESNSGTAYSGSKGSCGNTKNCSNNNNYFIVQARLYYINNKSFTQIGKTYYFVNSAGYNSLNGKGLNLIKVTNFDSYTNNNASYVNAYNYIKNTYLNNESNRKNLLNGITNTDDYDTYLNKDIDRTNRKKGYRLMIEPVQNYANPTFIDDDSTENSALYSVKGLATEIMKQNSIGNLKKYAEESNKNKELIQGVKNKAPWLYQDTNDVGVEAKNVNACTDLSIERISDIKYGCGYRLIDLSSYITTKKCYILDGVKTKNGGLKCTNYDENNEEEYSPNYKEVSCSGKSESEKLNIIEKYGKLVGGSNSCGIYCEEVADVSYPGNLLNPVQVGSYFSWPSRPDDTVGNYKMTVKTKLVCHTVGTQNSKVASIYQKKCPEGFEDWAGYINVNGKDVYYDICRSTNYQEPVCPTGYVVYNDNGTEICRRKTETSKICPSGYPKSISNTECRSETKKNPSVCNGDSIGGTCYDKNDIKTPSSTNKVCPSGTTNVNGTCYESTTTKVCASGYTEVAASGNNACRKQTGTNYSCPSGTTSQSGSGANLVCKKYTGYYCDAGYTLATNDTGTYCCKGNQCYTKGSAACASGWPEWKTNKSTYCWKYSKYSCDSGYQLYETSTERYCWKWSDYTCASGYGKWPSTGTCWRCAIESGWEAYYGNTRIYTSAVNETGDGGAGSCGWYPTSSYSGYRCSSGYYLSGTTCYKTTYNENASTCASKGGTFNKQKNNTTRNGTGACTWTKSATAYSGSTTSGWVEGGWLEGDAYWSWVTGTLYHEWTTGTLKGNTTETLKTVATPVYSYQAKNTCPSGYPTKVDNTNCRNDKTKNKVCPSGYPKEYDGKCYKNCDSGYTFVNGKCRKPINLVCKSTEYSTDGKCYDKKAKICDLSKTVEIGGKCYEKATKVCDSKLENHDVEVEVPGNNKTSIKKDTQSKVCPDGYEAYPNGYCYKTATDVSKNNYVKADSYTSKDEYDPMSKNLVCPSGYESWYIKSDGSWATDSSSGGTLECWKYADGSYYSCPSGYTEWPSYGKCYRCTIGSKYLGYNLEGYDNAGTRYQSITGVDMNNIWFCGYWTSTTSSTSYTKTTYSYANLDYGRYCEGAGKKSVPVSECHSHGVPAVSHCCRTTHTSVQGSSNTTWQWHEASVTGDTGWLEASRTPNKTSSVCPNGYPNYSTKTGKCYANCEKDYYFDNSGKCIRKTDKCVNKGKDGVCYRACSTYYTFNATNGKCELSESCKSGYLYSGKCWTCPAGSLWNGAGKCRKEKICPIKNYDGESGDSCYKNRNKANYCDTSSFNKSTGLFTFTSTGHTYINDLDVCVKCGEGFVISNGLCKKKEVVKLPATVSNTGNPPCYETTTKVNEWSCPTNYKLVGTRCVNNCSKEALVNGVMNSLNGSVSADLKGGTNQEIDDNLVATTAVTYDDSTTTFKTETTFKIKEYANRYFNKSSGLVANSASGWNPKDVFDRKEGVISLSLNDPVTENGEVKKYPLEIKNSKFGLVINYGNYINNYVCRYKTTTNSCKCPSGTDFAGVSLYDLTDNICNLEDDDNTCAELQYKYCNKPSKYYCKNSSNQLVDITSCVDNKIHNGKKPYNAFLECRNDTSECTKTCNLACKGDCSESVEKTGNVVLNITKCDGKYCNISPYCKTDGAIVSSSALECMATQFNLKSGRQLRDRLNSNSITLTQLKNAAKACESTICGKQKVIFRTIDLSDPFYGNGNRNYSGLSLKGNRSRLPGSNWNSVEVVTDKILKGRDKEGNKIYNKNYLYRIVITPQNTKDIREYNKSHSYNEFNLKCNDGEKTYGCISNFVHGDSDSLKDLGVEIKGVTACTSINLSTSSTDYKKCYNAKN